MLNPFGDADEKDDEVMEGFLCPICKAGMQLFIIIYLIHYFYEYFFYVL